MVSESSPSFRLSTAGMGDELPLLDGGAAVVVRYHGIDTGVSHEDTLSMPAIAGWDLGCDEELDGRADGSSR